MDLEEIPPPQGSSRATGGYLRGQAYGNVLNHADFPKLHSDSAPLMESAQVDYMIYAYLVYNDPVKIDATPDPSLKPNTWFHVLSVPPLDSSVVLKKVAERLDSVTSMYIYIYDYDFANCFKAAHVFVQSKIHGAQLWNLLGHFERVLEHNEPLDCTQDKECHILFVSIILISIFIFSYSLSAFQNLLSLQKVLHILLQPTCLGLVLIVASLSLILVLELHWRFSIHRVPLNMNVFM